MRGTFVRAALLYPCIVMGLIMIYFGIDGLLEPTRSKLLYNLGRISIAIVSNAAFAAGLWNPHWRRKLNKAT